MGINMLETPMKSNHMLNGLAGATALHSGILLPQLHVWFLKESQVIL